MIGGKQFDPVLGIDIHIIQPPGPVPPIPIPHPFVGMVMDPMDFVPFIGATVMVNSIPRAQAGSGGYALPPHIPLGGVFIKPPANECEVFMGSATVSVDGDAFTHLGLPALSCSDIGIPAPFRPKGSTPKSLMLPTSVVLCIPMGLPVLVGGPPTISLMALAMKAFMFLGKKVLKKFRKFQKGSKFWKKVSDKIRNKADNLMKKLGVPDGLRNKVSKGICTLTGHPVDVFDGRVITDAIDFELPGPLPIQWERTWYSSSDYDGPLGHGWHHAYDMALVADEQNVAVRLNDGRGISFPALRIGESAFNRWEKLTLHRHEHGYTLRDESDLLFQFQTARLGAVTPLKAIETRSGLRISFFYRPEGSLRRIVDSAGRELHVQVDAHQRIVRIEGPHATDPDQHQVLVEYRYDQGDLVLVRDPLSQLFRYHYQQHLLVQETNRNGLSFYFQWVGRGTQARCVRTKGDGGIYDHKLLYNPENRLTSVTNSLGHTTRFQFNEEGVAERIEDPLGGMTQTTYNAWNEPEEVSDALGQKTFSEFDDFGNLIKRVLPDGGIETFRWNAEHQLLEVIDAQGGAWRWEYNTEGQLIQRTNPLGHAEFFTYRRGLLIEWIDAAGSKTKISYDDHCNMIELLLPTGAAYQWTHDRQGRTLTSTNPLGGSRHFSRDPMGRLVGVIEPDGNRRQFSYDGESNLIRMQDSQRDIRMSYQGMGRLSSRTEAGTTIKFLYDTEEQLIALQNEHGLVYQFELDANGDVITESGFDGLRRRYRRDLAGRVVRIDRPNARFTDYAYDAMDRLLETRFSEGGWEKYQYRLDGQLMQAVNPHTQVRFDRDALGRITCEWQNGDWIVSEYDATGMRTGFRSSLGAVQTIERDSLGNTKRIGHADARSTNAQNNAGLQALWQAKFERDALGLELSRQLPGGIQSRWRRDSMGRVIEHTVAGSKGIWRHMQYRWDHNDRLKEVIDLQKGISAYGHDELGNLAWAQYPDGTFELRLPDSVGNLFRTRERSDRTYGPAGELIESRSPEGITRYEYDAEGFLIRKIAPGDRVWLYQWDGAGMLARVERPDGREVCFTYDALGRRLSKTFAGRTTRWIWDGNVPLHEWQEGTAEISLAQPPLHLSLPLRPPRDAQWGGPPPLGPPAQLEPEATDPDWHWPDPPSTLKLSRRVPVGLITWLFEPESFTPIAKLSDGEQLSILTDSLGVPVLMLDAQGEKVWSADISVYGKLRNVEGQASACPFRWPGQYEDIETGLYYNRFRYYDPDAGQYVSQDPIGLAGGLALCGYVDDPLTWVDPAGLNARTGAGRDHVTYRGVKNGKSYTGYASAPSELGLSKDEIVARRYNNDFSKFGGKRPTVVYSGSDTLGKQTARGLEQHYFEQDVKNLGRENVANAQNPVGPSNKKKSRYKRAANKHIKGCK